MLARPVQNSGRKFFKPDYIADSVGDIDFPLLQKRGVKAVLIDLDGTVVSRGTFDVEKKLTDYLKKQTVKIYIATNRPKSRDLKNLKESLHASGVVHPTGIFMKPLPKYFRQAVTDHQLKVSEVAMIGDRYIQDILGANRAGLTTVLVRKLGKSKGFIDSQISNLEKSYTNKLASQYIPANQSK